MKRLFLFILLTVSLISLNASAQFSSSINQKGNVACHCSHCQCADCPCNHCDESDCDC